MRWVKLSGPPTPCHSRETCPCESRERESRDVCHRFASIPSVAGEPSRVPRFAPVTWVRPVAADGGFRPDWPATRGRHGFVGAALVAARPPTFGRPQRIAPTLLLHPQGVGQTNLTRLARTAESTDCGGYSRVDSRLCPAMTAHFGSIWPITGPTPRVSAALSMYSLYFLNLPCRCRSISSCE